MPLNSALRAWPEPRPVGEHPPRSVEPASLRAAVTELLGVTTWASLTWTEVIDALAACGATNAGWARLSEGHADAVRILAQAGRDAEPGALYAVWASRSQGTGPAVRTHANSWQLSGTLRFASGVGVVDRALVTGVDADGRHHLFDMDVSDWRGDPASWASAGMANSRSWSTWVDQEVSVGDSASIREVREAGWYLARPGFAPGGVGVAAVWWGVTVGVLREAERLLAQTEPTREHALRWGRIRTELSAAGAVLEVAGRRLEGLLPLDEIRRWDHVDGSAHSELRELSAEARAVVATTSRRVLADIKILVGAVGLALDEGVSRALIDAEVYLAQHPDDRSAGALGERR